MASLNQSKIWVILVTFSYYVLIINHSIDVKIQWLVNSRMVSWWWQHAVSSVHTAASDNPHTGPRYRPAPGTGAAYSEHQFISCHSCINTIAMLPFLSYLQAGASCCQSWFTTTTMDDLHPPLWIIGQRAGCFLNESIRKCLSSFCSYDLSIRSGPDR